MFSRITSSQTRLIPRLAPLLVDGLINASPMPDAGRWGRPDAADPTLIAANREVREPHRLTVPIGDARRVEVDVERFLHRSEARLVDVHRHA